MFFLGRAPIRAGEPRATNVSHPGNGGAKRAAVGRDGSPSGGWRCHPRRRREIARAGRHGAHVSARIRPRELDLIWLPRGGDEDVPEVRRRRPACERVPAGINPPRIFASDAYASLEPRLYRFTIEAIHGLCKERVKTC